MTTLLGLRLEDVGEKNFSAAAKLSALNVAQRTAANFLHESYLTELETRANPTLSQQHKNAGAYPFGSSTIQPIRNRVHGVQVKYSGPFVWCIMIPFDDVKKTENMYMGADESNPLAYVFGNQLFIRPNFADIVGVAVYYLNSPSVIDASNNCVLNESLHDIVVDLAESELWRMDANVNRSQSARQSAMDQIKILNGRYEGESPTGVGHDLR